MGGLFAQEHYWSGVIDVWIYLLLELTWSKRLIDMQRSSDTVSLCEKSLCASIRP